MWIFLLVILYTVNIWRTFENIATQKFLTQKFCEWIVFITLKSHFHAVCLTKSVVILFLSSKFCWISCTAAWEPAGGRDGGIHCARNQTHPLWKVKRGHWGQWCHHQATWRPHWVWRYVCVYGRRCLPAQQLNYVIVLYCNLQLLRFCWVSLYLQRLTCGHWVYCSTHCEC